MLGRASEASKIQGTFRLIPPKNQNFGIGKKVFISLEILWGLGQLKFQGSFGKEIQKTSKFGMDSHKKLGNLHTLRSAI